MTTLTRHKDSARGTHTRARGCTRLHTHMNACTHRRPRSPTHSAHTGIHTGSPVRAHPHKHTYTQAHAHAYAQPTHSHTHTTLQLCPPTTHPGGEAAPAGGSLALCSRCPGQVSPGALCAPLLLAPPPLRSQLSEEGGLACWGAEAVNLTCSGGGLRCTFPRFRVPTSYRRKK